MPKGFSLAQILEWTSARLVNRAAIAGGEASIQVDRLAPLGVSRASDLAFFFSRDYEQELPSALPGILVTGEAFAQALEAGSARLPLWKSSAVIACRDPYFAMAILSEKFAAEASTVAHLPGTRRESESVVHPSAIVDPSARIGRGVSIGPHCVIEAGATIGDRTVLYPRVYVGPGARVGSDCVLFPGVTLYEWTEIGDRVRIHAGSTLGADGFGYAPQIENGVPVDHRKIYHLGRVVIGDDVEIGANSMVDRATFGETRIERKAKLDNHVHIGHNTTIGEGTILCGGSCTAGGTIIGRFVYVGGMSGLGNKATIGDFAKIGGMSMVDKDVPVGGTSVGSPQRTHRDHFKAHALLNRLVAERDRKGASKKEDKS